MNLQEELERAREAAPATELDAAAIYRKRERGARTRRLTTIAAALAIGLAGVAILVLTFDGASERRSVAPSVDLGLPAGSYYYERIDRYNLIPYPGTPDIETATEELWLAPDGSGRFYAHGKIVNYYEPFPGGGAHQDVSFSAGESPWEWVELPADPDAMREVLLSNGAPEGSSPVPATPSSGIDAQDWRIVRAAQDLLDRNALYLAPPQRQALFLVLRDLSFFKVSADALDPLGRTATELTAVVDEDRIRWYFDEGTGQWLARVLEKARTGEVLTAQLMFRQGVVADTSSSDPEPSFLQRPHPTDLLDFLPGALPIVAVDASVEEKISVVLFQLRELRANLQNAEDDTRIDALSKDALREDVDIVEAKLAELCDSLDPEMAAGIEDCGRS